MNKIYNNLSIESLIKTDWFNQFNKRQKAQIIRGLRENLDVSIYAKTEFDWEQMYKIREGLEDNLNVSIYAKSEIPWKKMEQIREKLLKESTLY